MSIPIQVQILARAAELDAARLIVLPLVAEEDGKAPLVKGWQKIRLSKARFEALMATNRSTIYGVRLDGMVVLDLDENDTDLVARLEEIFGIASVKVATPRGFHLYYSGASVNLPKLRQEGMQVDVLSGNKYYVVGPNSVRPCGGRYVEICGRLGETKLNPFPEPSVQSYSNPAAAPYCRFLSDGKVAEGHRNRHLLKRSIEFVQTCHTEHELFCNLMHVRDEECAEPGSVSDAELSYMAQWAFELSRQGELHVTTGGVFQVDRRFADLLLCNSDAIALYVAIKKNFGHMPGKTFQLCYKGMMEAQHINMSKNGFERAIKKLLETGAIVISKQYRVGVRKRTFCLGKTPHAVTRQSAQARADKTAMML